MGVPMRARWANVADAFAKLKIAQDDCLEFHTPICVDIPPFQVTSLFSDIGAAEDRRVPMATV